MKEKGFTLIELLAVIVLLAIVALIATPQILRLIEEAQKNSFIRSVEGIVRTVRLDNSKNDYFAENYTVTNGVIQNQKGKVIKHEGGRQENGMITIDSRGTVNYAIHNARWCATMGYDNSYVTDYNGKCSVAVSFVSTLASKVGIGGLTKITHDGDNTEYRYQGKKVDNYVSFNNEIWRIIGIVDGKIKIVKDEPLNQTRKWDCQGENQDSCTSSSNNWDTSSLKSYLNGDYYNGFIRIYQEMVADDATWYLGGNNSSKVSKEEMYDFERSASNVYGSNPSSSTTTKVGLINPSDYGYASTSCTGDFENYSDQECLTNNWMYLSNQNWWTMNANSDTSNDILSINSSGTMNVDSDSSSALRVRPVLYLRGDLPIQYGDGTSPETAYRFNYESEYATPEMISGPNFQQALSYYKPLITSVDFRNTVERPSGDVIAIYDVSDYHNGSVMAYVTLEDGKYKLYIGSNEKVLANTNESQMFMNFTNLSTINHLDLFDTSHTTDMSYMFYGTTNLATINFNELDMSSVTNMDYFINAYHVQYSNEKFTECHDVNCALNELFNRLS